MAPYCHFSNKIGVTFTRPVFLFEPDHDNGTMNNTLSHVKTSYERYNKQCINHRHRVDCCTVPNTYPSYLPAPIPVSPHCCCTACMMLWLACMIDCFIIILNYPAHYLHLLVALYASYCVVSSSLPIFHKGLMTDTLMNRMTKFYSFYYPGFVCWLQSHGR